MDRILIVDPIHDLGSKILERSGLKTVFPECKDEVGIAAAVQGAWGMIVRTSCITRSIIDKGDSLKIIGRHGAGIDNIDVDFATERGIVVVNTPDANTIPVVEYVLGSILTLAKGFGLCDTRVKQGEWAFRESFKPVEINGKIIGIVGYGRIGRELAGKALALNMQVHIFDPYIAGNSDIDGEYMHYCRTLDDLLEQSDFVSLHLPYSRESAGLIDLNKIKKMKKSAFLINAARGGIVVEDDLCRALSQKLIAGAAVDVFAQEPPSGDNPILTLDNILLTPHNAALTIEATKRASTTVAEDIAAYYRGDKPLNPVNPAVLP